MRLFFLMTLAVTAIACAGPPEKMYLGPERPFEETALLREGTGARVVEIDGVRTKGGFWALLPGEHDALLRVRVYTHALNVTYTIWTWCDVRFDAEPGQEYESVVRLHKEVASGLREKVAMEIGIADAEGQLMSQAHSCREDRPGEP